MSDRVIFVSSEVQGLSCNEVVQRIVVESRDVGWFPYFVLETFPKLVLNNVVVVAIEENSYFLLFESRHNLKVKFIEQSYNRIVKKGLFGVYLFDKFAKMFVDEILFSLKHINQLFEVLKLH